MTWCGWFGWFIDALPLLRKDEARMGLHGKQHLGAPNPSLLGTAITLRCGAN